MLDSLLMYNAVIHLNIDMDASCCLSSEWRNVFSEVIEINVE